MTPDEGQTCTLVREGPRRMTKPSSVQQLKASHESQEGLYSTADRLIVSRKVTSTLNSILTPTHSNQIGRNVIDSYPALTKHCRRMRPHCPVACARRDSSQWNMQVLLRLKFFFVSEYVVQYNTQDYYCGTCLGDIIPLC